LLLQGKKYAYCDAYQECHEHSANKFENYANVFLSVFILDFIVGVAEFLI
jgi:hypothetical protein